MSEDGLRDAIRAARKKRVERKKKRPTNYSKVPKKRAKHAIGADGEPTTDALELWRAEDFLEEFSATARASIDRYRAGAKLHEVKAVKEFIDVLADNDACPRSQLLIIREAARRLNRYKKDWKLSTAPGAWWLRTHMMAILVDLRHLLYTDYSLRYLMTEDVPTDMLTIVKKDECWVFSWKGVQTQIHESQMDQIKNPSLLHRIGGAPAEEIPDNENFSGW